MCRRKKKRKNSSSKKKTLRFRPIRADQGESEIIQGTKNGRESSPKLGKRGNEQIIGTAAALPGDRIVSKKKTT